MAYLEDEDLSDVNAAVGFENPPPGTHPMEITQVELSRNSGDTGDLIEIFWVVFEGEHQGKSIVERINHNHQSEKANEFGRRQKKALVDAFGMPRLPQDTNDFIGHQAFVVVGMDKGSDAYPSKPEVKGVRPYTAQPPSGKPQRAPAPTPARAPAPVAPAKPRAAAPAAASNVAPLRRNGGWVPPGKSAPAPAHAGDDEIPF